MPGDQPQHVHRAVRQVVRIRSGSDLAHTKVRRASEKVIANVLEQTSSLSIPPCYREGEADSVMSIRFDLHLLIVASVEIWTSHDSDCSLTTWLKIRSKQHSPCIREGVR